MVPTQIVLTDAPNNSVDTPVRPEVTAAVPAPQASVESNTEDVFQPSPNEPTGVSIRASETFLALQRLFPATSFTYTVPSDGSTFTDINTFNSIILEDVGEDSVIVLPLPDSSTEFCTYDSTVEYFCLRLFENGIGLLKLFSLETNNSGSGTFHACEAIALDVNECISELLSTPSGTLTIEAGLSTENIPESVSTLNDGGGYLQYLGAREPAQLAQIRSHLVPIESILALQDLVNLAIRR